MRLGMAFHWAVALGLFCYYGLASVMGAILWQHYFFLGEENLTPDLNQALLASVSASLVGSGLFYARKLYKDIFAYNSDTAPSRNALIATTAYFLFRPFFGIVLAGVSSLSAFAFIHITTTSESHIGLGFLVFSSLAGLLVAGATGRGVQRLEELGRDSLGLLRTAS